MDVKIVDVNRKETSPVIVPRLVEFSKHQQYLKTKAAESTLIRKVKRLLFYCCQKVHFIQALVVPLFLMFKELPPQR